MDSTCLQVRVVLDDGSELCPPAQGERSQGVPSPTWVPGVELHQPPSPYARSLACVRSRDPAHRYALQACDWPLFSPLQAIIVRRGRDVELLSSSQTPISLRCELNGRCVAKSSHQSGAGGMPYQRHGTDHRHQSRRGNAKSSSILRGKDVLRLDSTRSRGPRYHRRSSISPALLAVEVGSPCPPPRRTPLRDAVCDS